MSDNYEPEHRAGYSPDDYEEPLIGDAPPRANTLFSNNVYDKLKFLAQVLLPALGTLYFGVAGIWGLPHAQDVVGTIVVVDTFLGIVLGLSTQQYKNDDSRFDGHISVESDEEAGETRMNVSLDPAAIAGKDEVLVKVQK